MLVGRDAPAFNVNVLQRAGGLVQQAVPPRLVTKSSVLDSKRPVFTLALGAAKNGAHSGTWPEGGLPCS